MREGLAERAVIGEGVGVVSGRLELDEDGCLPRGI